MELVYTLKRLLGPWNWRKMIKSMCNYNNTVVDGGFVVCDGLQHPKQQCRIAGIIIIIISILI